MPFREWSLRIRDMIAAATETLERTAGMNWAEFESADSLFIKGILYNFVIMGEAAINIPQDIQQRYPHIPWQLIGDMRNVMAHEYFQVELDKIWETIENDLSKLIRQLQDILEQETQNEF